MVFNSPGFVLFVGAAYFIFLLLPARLKTPFLVAASYLFYGFSSVRACVFLAAVSLVCYWGGVWIERARERPRGQWLRLVSLVGLLGALLLYFKFVPLIASHLRGFAESVQAGRPEFLLLFVPVGFSYYLFQGIGYLVDVFWGKPRAGSVWDFLLFMAFFPKVMMGPIERGDHLLPQIAGIGRAGFDYDRLREGLLLFGWGLFKKLVVADRLALFVNEIYQNPGASPGFPVAAAAVCFTFQLYSDFSGYTDMALGVGRLFGLELTQNFNRPFAATSIQDFWRRWHISFSTWIGDYLFLPLRMSLRSAGKAGLLTAIIITFFLVGVWHGTGWAFAIFGLLQGVYMAGSTLTLASRNAFWERHGQGGKLWLLASRRLITFSMVTLSLVFFRAESIPAAFGILRGLVGGVNLEAVLHRPEVHVALALIVIMELAEGYIRGTAAPFARLLMRPLWQRWAAYILVLLGILFGGVFTSAQRFIYFAF